MAIWMYAASSNFAGANATFDLAYRHGIVWRSFYADRTPQQAIPNVSSIAAGDTIDLGYRDSGSIQLVGRMRVGRPEHPEPVSPVFTSVPDVLLAEFLDHGYANDPVLGRMLGIFVEEVEPLTGTVPSPGRLTITALSRESNDRPGGAPQQSARQASTTPAAILNDGSYIGIDVGGRSGKGFDLCNLIWSNGVPATVRFIRVPHRTPLPSTATLRSYVGCGDLDRLAALTHSSAASIGNDLWASIVRLTGSAPAGVFIDSPSAFARNMIGHGRLTEKSSIPGVSFQSTPSIACGREHNADWAWLLYGIVAFAACVQRGSFTIAEWKDALTSGLFNSAQASSPVIRECFPTATISHLRARGKASVLQSLLRGLPNSPERDAVVAYLESGVQCVKRPGQSLFDRADALVAALSSLPYVRPDFAESLAWPSATSTRWQAADSTAHVAEGAIALVE